MKAAIPAALLAALSLGAAALSDDKVIRIGSLDDQSGIYADIGGPGSTIAAEMAIEGSGLREKGWTISVIAGDHQNKPDIGAAIARKWFEEDKLDVIGGGSNSAVGLVVSAIAKEKNRVFLVTGRCDHRSHGRGLLAQHDPLGR